MESVFITGTDTGVGKTEVVGLLGRYLLEAGCSVVTQKPIQTGAADLSLDVDRHLELMGRTRGDIERYLGDVEPYVFGLAASPHLAAKVENKRIDAEKIRGSFEVLSDEFDCVIVEGLGGVLVPFDGESLAIDIFKGFGLPVVIVAANKLGAINHTLLTIEALKARGMEILGVVFNSQPGKQEQLVLEDNPKIIGELSGETILGVLPWERETQVLYKAFGPIGEKIYRGLMR